MEISKFSGKLNKIEGNTYVVEEEIHPAEGVYEGELRHDNINTDTLSVYTGPKLTGKRVDTYALSTPSLMPWKRIIRVYSGEPVLYVSYETEGDTVEAEDINRVQEAVTATQEALNRENSRAQAMEETLAQKISAETLRADAREAELQKGLNQEAARAQNREAEIQENLNQENTRAQNRETELDAAVKAEAARAAAEESSLKDDMENHVRSVDAELQMLRQADTEMREQKADVETMNTALAERYTKNQVYTKEEVLAKIEELIGTAPDTLDTFKEIADALGNDPDFAATMMNALAGKVDKETGKGLSSNDFTDEDKAAIRDLNGKKHSHSNKDILDKITQILIDNWTYAYEKRHEHGNKGILDTITQTLIDTWNTVSNKVDKESGKGLSSNDFTTTEKDKLAGIETGAQVNAVTGIKGDTETSYRTGDINITPDNIGAVPADGGIFTGEITMQKGSVTSRQTGTSGTKGYVKIAQLKVKNFYVNHPVIFEIAGRGWSYSRKLYVLFNSEKNTNPFLSDFLIDNPAPYSICIVKSGTSMWDIYSQKNEPYGACYITSMHNTASNDNIEVTFPGTQVSTLPSGIISPTVITWNNAVNADTVDGKHASDLQDYNNLTNRPNIPAAVAVKGNAESSYRTGNVNITPDNIGALPLNGGTMDPNAVIRIPTDNLSGGVETYETGDGDKRTIIYADGISTTGFLQGNTSDSTVTFTSGDGESPTSWTDVKVLASRERHSSLFNKISIMFKNIRYLYKMLGSTDIKKLGNGTVTGALTTLNSSLSSLSSRINPAMVVDGSIDNLPPGLYWINGYSSNIEGDIPFTGIHYMLMVSGDKTIGNNQMAVTNLCQIKFRHRDGTGVSWSAWVQDSRLTRYDTLWCSPNTNVINVAYAASNVVTICGNTVTIQGYFTQAYFYANTPMFYIPESARPAATRTGIIKCNRSDGTAAVQAIYADASGNIYQSFNSDGTVWKWSGEFFIQYIID